MLFAKLEKNAVLQNEGLERGEGGEGGGLDVLNSRKRAFMMDYGENIQVCCNVLQGVAVWCGV